MTLEVVAAKIREHVLHGSMDRLEAAIVRVVARRRNEPPKVDKAAIRRRLTVLDTKIANATDRLVTIDSLLVPDVEAKLIELKRQRVDIEAELETIQSKPPPVDAKAVAAKIWQLDTILRNGSPAVTRAALSKIIDRVVLNFKEAGSTEKRRRFAFTGGVIELISKEYNQQGLGKC